MALVVAALTAAVPAAASACSAKTRPDPSVPAFKRVTGLTLGARQASPAQIDRYMRAVDAASPRVHTFLAGRSAEGRPIRVAVVGTRANVAPARLEALAAEMRGLRDGAFDAARVTTIGRTRPAFVWFGASVHGNEPSGGDADVRLLYRLASGRTCADQKRLKRVVVFLMPLQNPDGRAARERHNARGFDLNRDWFARTQPETEAKVAALVRYPPTVFADQHEEGGTGFFFPPNADPVHHEISAQAIRAINQVVAPRLRRAFRARRIDFLNYQTYDMFFMGYGDSAPSTLFGAAGMTFEKGGQSGYPTKTAEQFLAADQTVSAAASHHVGLLTRWGRQWPQARAQGAAGTLQPNRIVAPGAEVQFQVPDQRVHGYVLVPGPHAPDAAALVRRLVSVGVTVQRLAADTPVAGLRGFGEPAPGAATLAAGTYYVPMAQAAKHWIQALLGDDPYVPFPYFYDVSSWSNPLLMGLDGGVLTQPLPADAGTVAADPPAPDPGEAPAHAFPGGAQGSVELVFALLRDGLAVRRQADGTFTVEGGRQALTAHAPSRHVQATPLGAPPAGGAPVRLPRVGMLADPDEDLSGGWARWLLEHRLGLTVPTFSGAAIAAGKLSAVDALVVPDGNPGALSRAALTALQAWVRNGGTFVGWRSRGLAVADAAGLTGVRTLESPPGFQVPGVSLRVSLDPADPVAFGEEGESFVFNTDDPILQPNGANVVARYPADGRFFVSGHASGTSALKGTAAATHETLGAGRVVLFAFDPVFRGYTEGTERLVGNALLAPAPAPGTASVRRAPRPVSPAALALARPPHRDVTVQVAAADEAGLLAAAAAAGVPPRFVIERDLTTVTLRVRDLTAGGTGEHAAWTGRLPGELARAGVRPLLAIL